AHSGGAAPAAAPEPPQAPTTARVATDPKTTPAPPPAPEPAAPVVTAAPAPLPPPPKEFQPNSALNMIHFDFDKAEIRPDDARILDANANWLRDNPKQLVLIEGHCDERGTPAYNLDIGDRRDKSTINYLAS